MVARRLNPYDEDYAPAVSPWLTLVLFAETRAPTKPLDHETLATLVERCNEHDK